MQGQGEPFNLFLETLSCKIHFLLPLPSNYISTLSLRYEACRISPVTAQLFTRWQRLNIQVQPPLLSKFTVFHISALELKYIRDSFEVFYNHFDLHAIQFNTEQLRDILAMTTENGKKSYRSVNNTHTISQKLKY